jgi:hypothetical protein
MAVLRNRAALTLRQRDYIERAASILPPSVRIAFRERGEKRLTGECSDPAVA